jgi:hypothetical protein
VKKNAKWLNSFARGDEAGLGVFGFSFIPGFLWCFYAPFGFIRTKTVLGLFMG